MKLKKLEVKRLNEEYYDNQRKRERTRRYLISVAELNQLIVRKFKSSTTGFMVSDVVAQFPDYSLQLIKDALESAVEDEYFKVETTENGSLFYIPIIYDEYN